MMAAVMIGVDPHKGSHTAVAIGADEVPVGLVRVRACAAQAERLLAWAKSWPERTWAVEGAAGLGHLLAQQLVAAGERVLDVQPKLAARVRLLATGAVNKNDPNDARSVAIAALRAVWWMRWNADGRDVVELAYCLARDPGWPEDQDEDVLADAAVGGRGHSAANRHTLVR